MMSETSLRSRAARRFTGPGGAVTPRNILLVTATVAVATDTTIGGTPSPADLTDIVVYRDLVTGFPAIPATGMTGALAAFITALPDLNPRAVTEFFGTVDAPARFRPWDMTAHPGYPPTGIRDGVAVDLATGTALPGHLFSSEVVSAGTTFPLVWEIHLPVDAVAAHDTVTVVAAAAAAVADGSIRLGHRTHAGRGEIVAHDWAARLFDLCGSDDDHRTWYSTPHHAIPTLAEHPATDPPQRDVATVLTAVCPPEWPGITTPQLNRRSTLDIEMTIRNEQQIGDDWYPGTYLIGGDVTDDNATRHLRHLALTPDGTATVQPLDAGTTVVSMLRRTAQLAITAIAATARDTTAANGRAEHLLTDLFGPHPSQQLPITAARISVNETALLDTTNVTLMTTPINPIAHTTINHHLAHTEPVFGGHRRLRITVVDPAPADFAILTVIVKDLITGHAQTSGADTATGSGRRRATDLTASFTPPDPHAAAAQSDVSTVYRWTSWDDWRTDTVIVGHHRTLIAELTA